MPCKMMEPNLYAYLKLSSLLICLLHHNLLFMLAIIHENSNYGNWQLVAEINESNRPSQQDSPHPARLKNCILK